MKIYIAKEYAYKQWHVLIGGTITTLFGGIILFFFIIPSAIRTDWTYFKLTSIPGLILSFGIPTLLLSAGVWIMHAWFTKRVNRLEISDIGIKYGSKMRPWEQIKWFSIHYPKRGTPTLFYQKKGFSVDYNLMVTDPLTDDEIRELFVSLKKKVLPLHPNLQIG